MWIARLWAVDTMKYWILLAVCFAAGCDERAEQQRPPSEQECTAAEKLLYAAPGCGAEVMPRCLGAAGACVLSLAMFHREGTTLYRESTGVDSLISHTLPHGGGGDGKRDAGGRSRQRLTSGVLLLGSLGLRRLLEARPARARS